MAVLMNPAIYVATQERYRVAIVLLYSRMVNLKNPRKFQHEMRRVTMSQSHVKPGSQKTNNITTCSQKNTNPFSDKIYPKIPDINIQSATSTNGEF